MKWFRRKYNPPITATEVAILADIGLAREHLEQTIRVEERDKIRLWAEKRRNTQDTNTSAWNCFEEMVKFIDELDSPDGGGLVND